MPQELNTKMMGDLPEGQIRPFDTVKVYATGLGGFHKEGEELVVHPELAKKLIAGGGATKEKIKAKEPAPKA